METFSANADAQVVRGMSYRHDFSPCSDSHVVVFTAVTYEFHVLFVLYYVAICHTGHQHTTAHLDLLFWVCCHSDFVHIYM